MDIFYQNKMLSRLLVALVILNTFLVIFLFWQNQQPSEKDTKPVGKDDFEYVSKVLQRELNLSEKQVAQFRELRNDFFKKERILSLKIRAERDSMNVAMFNKSTDDQLIDSLANHISMHEYEMEIYRYEQAKELKKICSPEQMEKFETLVLEIRDYFKPDKPTKK
jgi:Spy/CpxP family protein refolding chaperone